MTKWEYKIIDIRSMRTSDAALFLNDYGGQGWELCCFSADGHYATFKRSVDENPKRS